MGVRSSLRKFLLGSESSSSFDASSSFITTPAGPAPSFAVVAGLSDILKDTEKLRTDSNYDNEFDIFDAMVKLDPELNGAVRSVSLTANNYSIDYEHAKNEQIRSATKELIERIEFDDLLINAMRDMMVYGNSINKLVGRAGEGISKVQSLPIKQITILDNRSPLDPGYSGTFATKNDPIMVARKYKFREQGPDEQTFEADEILHFRIDFRSNWFQDHLGRWTYGVWGASRFTSLKQAIRAKYNSINNRIALEDSLTKQYIKIGKEAIEGIPDPEEARERLTYIMQEVATLLQGLRADQVPILPHYVDMHHIDMSTAMPDNSGFLESINADISAVLNVPRVASGQERGSTFAATYNANLWSVMSIERLQAVVTEIIRDLFSKNLELLGIPHRERDLPILQFEQIESESPLHAMQRAQIGLTSGILTPNEARDQVGLYPIVGGDELFVEKEPQEKQGELPRENSQPGKEIEA
jgi:low affinity Fe/Cu permease